MKKYNVIGDIHGRTCWRQLVKADAVNIFLGDYLDPYEFEGITYEQAFENLKDIIAYKHEHMDTTVLLMGNHDLHYLWSDKERYSRYNSEYAAEFASYIRTELLPLAQLGYCVDGKVLVTHAGVTGAWWSFVCKTLGRDLPKDSVLVADVLNTLLHEHFILTEHLFGAKDTFDPYDRMGISPTASPIWVRPETLDEFNLFKGTEVQQIVGHSQMEDFDNTMPNLHFVDCLGYQAKSYEFEM